MKAKDLLKALRELDVNVYLIIIRGLPVFATYDEVKQLLYYRVDLKIITKGA